MGARQDRRARAGSTQRIGVVVVALVGLLAAALASPAAGQARRAAPVSITTPNADRCDPLGGPRCSLPFPNDFATVADASTPTGRRVHLVAASLPANASGVHIDPTEQDRNDGFSPGSALLAQFPGLDLARTKAAPVTDMAASLRSSSPIVIVDAATGERVAHWAELDANAPTAASQLLIVRPARNLLEGHHYVVGLRHLVNAYGGPIAPTPAFQAVRDRTPTTNAAIEARRPALETDFTVLAGAGVARTQLTAAWDFTVASGKNLSERLLHMRDDAFAALGDAAPAFHVDSVEAATDANALRVVRGTFEVPRYLTGQGEPGSVLNNGTTQRNALPRRNGTQTANFVCVVPTSSIDATGRAHPTRMALYGHGLLGTADQVVGTGSRFQGRTNTTFCATDWIGMAEEDVANAVSILQDLGKFRSLADRLQQGILDFLFLGRLMKHPAGLTSDPAFQDAAGRPLLDHQHLSFVGVSQGGILGGATTAVAQDWTRAFLGVPAMNYSTLLNRSVDFDTYGLILIPAYPDAADRQIGLNLIQMLWDRGENDGYAEHLTSHPYRATPAKQVFLFEAFGDHQVANVATEVMARTIGAVVRTPSLAPGRSPDRTPAWGITPATNLPVDGGSYLVTWDFGTPAPPTTNTPPRQGDDPHGFGTRNPAVQKMAAAFLNDGRLIDVCGAGKGLPLDAVLNPVRAGGPDR